MYYIILSAVCWCNARINVDSTEGNGHIFVRGRWAAWWYWLIVAGGLPTAWGLSSQRTAFIEFMQQYAHIFTAEVRSTDYSPSSHPKIWTPPNTNMYSNTDHWPVPFVVTDHNLQPPPKKSFVAYKYILKLIGKAQNDWRSLVSN